LILLMGRTWHIALFCQNEQVPRSDRLLVQNLSSQPFRSIGKKPHW